MNKMFLFIPVGLIAASSLIWVDSQNTTQKNPPQKVEIGSKTPEQLFALSQDSLRRMVRDGDKGSIQILKDSVNELEVTVMRYEKQGLAVGKVEGMIAQYKDDSRVLSEAVYPFLEKLDNYDNHEKQMEPEFLRSLDQIGLYELKTTYNKLSQKRLDYIKEPSLEAEKEYRELSEMMKQMVVELYLDQNVEKPLFAYMENHKEYFKTIASFYTKAGMDRVHRLRENSYAIKTELQMLPTL